MHCHKYLGPTSIEDYHLHYYKGSTTASEDTPGHIHHLTGETSFEDGHIHEYDISTGPAIYTETSHYHMFCGITSVNDEHYHTLWDSTRPYHIKEACCCYKDP